MPSIPESESSLTGKLVKGYKTAKSGTDPDKDRGRLNRNGIPRLIEVDKCPPGGGSQCP
jgi:hypothetical protein